MKRVVAELVTSAAEIVVSEYYSLKPGTPVKEVLRRWKENGDKALDNSMPVWYKARELWPWREYTWSRKKSRGGHARVGGKTVWLDGPAKWDALKADLKLNGWDETEPLHMSVGKNGKAKVGEGNHRLAIAYDLNIKVPVWFHFNQVVELNPQNPEKIVDDIPKKAIRKAFDENAEDYGLDEETIERNKRRVDEILKLLESI